jgi:3-phenylpropionate/trans-cinnamate dioxygenase ferredoxin reductase subunit
MSDLRRIVIIGAGECGTRAALALREDGYDGAIDLINGEVADPYERPPLSKPGPDELVLKPIMGSDRFASENITLHRDLRAVQIDRHAKTVALSNGDRLSYDCLVLATGARPRKLTLDGLEREDVQVLRTFNDARALYNELKPGCRLTIIGGGFIGLELAAAARQREVETTVIEVAPRLLGRAVPAGIAARVEARHRAAGVIFHIGKSISSIKSSHVITLSDGVEISSDVIVAGIGSVPNVELAEAAGLLIDNGIAVDEHLRTSDPDIFAAGDCCSFPHPLYGQKRMRLESWRAAQEQGAYVARAVLGTTEPYSAVPWFWSDHYDLSLQIAGMPSEGTKTVTRSLDEESVLLFHLDEAGRLVAASGIGPGNRIARDIRLSEMLIEKQVHPSETALADPSVTLKSILSSASS